MGNMPEMYALVRSTLEFLMKGTKFNQCFSVLLKFSLSLAEKDTELIWY